MLILPKLERVLPINNELFIYKYLTDFSNGGIAMAVDEKKPINAERCWVLKLGGLTVALYWLIATVGSTLFNENSNFLVNLYNPGLKDMILRVLTAAVIMGASLLIQRRLSALQAQNSLLGNELASLEHLLETAEFPIIELDQQLRIKSINNAALRLIGAKGDDFNYQYVVPALFHSEDHEEIKNILEDTRTEMENKVYRLKVRRVHPCYVTIRLSKETTDGKITRQLLFLTDVSAAAARISAAEEQAAAILAQVASHPLPVAVFDLKHLHFVNQAMQNILALSEAGISYEKLVEHLRASCQDSEVMVEAIARTLQEQTSQKVAAIFDLGGQPRHVRINLRPVQLQDPGILMWIEDMTELAAKDNAISQLEQELDLLRKNELDLRMEFQQHAERHSDERNRLLNELSNEQQQAAKLRDELETAKERIANLEQQLQEQSEGCRQLQEEISQLREDNTSLANSAAQMQYQWEALQLPIMQLDQEGKLIKVNPAAKTMLGLREDTHLQSYLARSEEQQKLAAFLQELVNVNQRAAVELEFFHNGRQITVSCHGVKLHKPQDQFVIYGCDITALKQAQAELAMTLDNNRFELEDVLNEMEIERERMNAILAGISDGVVITDMYNRVIKMNPAAEDILGIRLSQALERPVHFIIRNPEIIGHMQQTVREKLFNHRFSLEVPDLGGTSTMTLSCSTTVIHDRNLYDHGVIIHLHKV